ncbi:hypothetical protein CcCBS67573_g02334 [Chytriomyces confervae]|uniref:AB hydrolase-1 domain-containing protein n=1 Tax=Chytriomyces confervae TaxID=246404 RepID=A0A507FJE8_9FUNG|nr:hypothetical protein CcCBS67573_g02334 [Chytriomyces confervae]
MPIGHSFPKLVAIRLLAFFLDAIPFSAAVFTAVQLYYLVATPSYIQHVTLRQAFGAEPNTLKGRILDLLPAYFCMEVAFLVYFYTQHKRLQKPVVPPTFSDAERGAHFFKVLDSSSQKFEEFFSGWFYWTATRKQLSTSEMHLIRKDNFRDWIAWSFFSAPNYETLRNDPRKSHLADELDGYISDMEIAQNIKIQPGRNRDITALILQYNPVEATPKPLILYLIIWSLESCGLLLMSVMGFSKVSPEQRPYQDSSKTRCLNYWVFKPKKADASMDRLPIVFFHGIGCGLFPYLHFIFALLHQAKFSRPMFVVELPHVAMRLVDHVPSMEQTISEVETMLDVHGYAKAHIIGHSLGTTVSSWMIKYSKYAASCVLLDPVVFLYLFPALAFNFVHRVPGLNTPSMKANEYLLHWLCSRELHTHHSISRHFFWTQNVLWPEKLPENHHIYIAKQDFLFDGHMVADYLAENNVSHDALDVGHAGFLLSPRVMMDIVHRIGSVCEQGEAKVKAEREKETTVSKSLMGSKKQVRSRRRS